MRSDEARQVYLAAFVAALAALVGIAIMLSAALSVPEGVGSLQPTAPIAGDADFFRPISEAPQLMLRFFAGDSLFVLSYTVVFAGLYATTSKRSRLLAALGLGAGLLTALADTVENAYLIAFAARAIEGTANPDTAPIILFVLATLKWWFAFATLLIFGLIWPRNTNFDRSLAIFMLLFVAVGIAGVANPSLIDSRGLFFLIGMPLFAVHFWQHARSA